MKIDVRTVVGCGLFTLALVTLPLPNGFAGFGRMELLSNACFLLSALLLFSRHDFKGIPPALVGLWGAFSVSVLLSSIITSADFVEAVKVCRRVWLIPTAAFMGAYMCARKLSWLWFAANLCAGMIGAVFVYLSMKHTPQGVYIPEIQGWTGPSTRLYRSYFDDGIWMNGPTALGYAFPLALGLAYFFLHRHWIVWAAGASGFLAYAYTAIKTGTRTGIAVVSVCFALVVAQYLIRSRKIVVILSACGIGIVAAVVALVLFRSADITDEMLSRFTLAEMADTSASGRTKIWHEKIKVIQQEFWGVGLLRAAEMDILGMSTHNAFIEAFHTTGWVAGALFAAVFAMALAWAVKISMVAPQPQFQGVLFVICLFLTYGMLEAVMSSSTTIYYSWFACLGVAVERVTQLLQGSNRISRPQRITRKSQHG